MKGLQAGLAKHRKELMIAGAGLVAALGLYQHQKAKSAPSGGDSTAAAPDGATIGGYAPAGATGGPNYDSTGNDVYNALQPQMEQTQSLLAQLLDRLNGGGTSTTPTTPATPTTPTKTVRPAAVTATPTAIIATRTVGNTRLPGAGEIITRPRPVPRPAPRPIPTSYVVRRGDTLSSIAAATKVGSWLTLYQSNRSVIGSNPNQIKPGQKLTIPR